MVRWMNTNSPPSFVGGTPLATFDDAVVLNDVSNTGIADLGLFTPTQQASLLAVQSDLNAIVAAGAGSFTSGDVTTLLLSALDYLAALETLDCDGFL